MTPVKRIWRAIVGPIKFIVRDAPVSRSIASLRSIGSVKMLNGQFNRITKRSFAEGRTLLWIFLYLWILLGLFAAYKSIVLNEPNLFYHQGFAFIHALLLAKIMLVAEMLRIADNLGHKPLGFRLN
jgi:hypothetical protein